METPVNRSALRRRIRYRIRKKVHGTATRPRLAVFRSLRHIYAQAIDDETGRTLAQASTLSAELRNTKGAKTDAAASVGKAIAGKLKQAGVETVVFDRGGSVYHGRVKGLADAARKEGLKF